MRNHGCVRLCLFLIISAVSAGALGAAEPIYTSALEGPAHSVGTTVADTVQVAFWDFQDAVDPSVGDAQGWTGLDLTGQVGDFAQVWSVLADVDPCDENTTPQFAFIDDGVVVPGVGPSTSPTWTYGPSGYVTNTTGGLAGPGSGVYLDNAIVSPVIALPADHTGHELRFGVYRHSEYWLVGQFYTCGVLSSVDGITWEEVYTDGYLRYGQPQYVRHAVDLSHMLCPGAGYARVVLRLLTDLDFAETAGEPATPAPYFDNVSWHAYAVEAPSITLREEDRPHDAFPAVLDWSDLGAADVRFDTGYDVVRGAGPGIVHGDSIVISARSLRPGGALVEAPRMVYAVHTNPVFDAYRTSGVAYSGYVTGDSVRVGGVVVEDLWAFDLPDEDFLYPGDVLHYYFSATDEAPGGGTATATLPVDISEFGVFMNVAGTQQVLAWHADYTVRCLPSVGSLEQGDVPSLLVWDDSGVCGEEYGWLEDLYDIGVGLGVQYDVFYTRSPSGGLGNGLGAACPADILQHYDNVFYDSGSQSMFTICGPKVLKDSGYWGDGSDDISLLTAFVEGGGNLLACGDDMMVMLYVDPSGDGVAMVGDVFGVAPLTLDIRAYIDNQSDPYVAPVEHDMWVGSMNGFVALGGCPVMKRYDGIHPSASTASVVAEFLDPTGASGAYPDFAAMVLNERPGMGQVISCPVSYRNWRSDIPNRFIVERTMCDILGYWDIYGCVVGADDPIVAPLITTRNWPNPCNPQTTIRLNLPLRGRVSLKLYDVRGELVRTLLDEVRDAGEHAVPWNGRDDAGRALPSGVYFYEVRSGGRSSVGKTALVK